MIPPPPTPCITRPTSMVVKLFEAAETAIPIKKQLTQNVNTGIRPKMLDSAAIGS